MQNALNIFGAWVIYQMIGFVLLTLTSKKGLLGQIPVPALMILVLIWPVILTIGAFGAIVRLGDYLGTLLTIVRNALHQFLVKRGWLSLLLLAIAVTPAMAQAPAATKNPKLSIFVDTAGVSRVMSDIYVTWVFAKASPNALPSSGVLVAFDCKNSVVKRLAHVVYHLNSDSTGVTGTIVEDNQTWVAVSIPALYELVCAIGPTHADAMSTPSTPQMEPQPQEPGHTS